jgi:hypothetical protein
MKRDELSDRKHLVECVGGVDLDADRFACAVCSRRFAAKESGAAQYREANDRGLQSDQHGTPRRKLSTGNDE